ncbi:MAG: hypothetical protein ACFNS9_03030, partial [Actinomyces sp.]
VCTITSAALALVHPLAGLALAACLLLAGLIGPRVTLRAARGAELDVPTSPAAPASAANLGPAGRDTNVADPTTLTDPMNDPYVL